jgi:alditol oxidase
VGTSLTNWAGNYTYRATNLHRPASLDELSAIVASAPKIRALGSRHCFNDIADSAELISVEGLDQAIEIDRDASTVTFNAAMRYGDLALALERQGLAIHNMASLPHISVGGAVATSTHGSGDRNGNLATAVAGLELVTSEGEILRVKRGDADFNGMVVGIGALGVITRLTLDIQPSFQMRQRVYQNLDWSVVSERFDDVMSAAYSVSLFTDYGDTVGEVWCKSRLDVVEDLGDDLLGAPLSTLPLHPVPSLSPENCTEQRGVPGAWLDRLPHFRLDAIPASGDELQTEYMIARHHAVEALQIIRDLSPKFRPPLMISEVRTSTADDLWLSSAYGRDTVCIHFSWRNDWAAVKRVLPLIEEALAPFSPRPHWGKLFLATAAEIAPRYERLPDFRRLAERLDRRGAFRNAFLDRHVFGD